MCIIETPYRIGRWIADPSSHKYVDATNMGDVDGSTVGGRPPYIGTMEFLNGTGLIEI